MIPPLPYIKSRKTHAQRHAQSFATRAANATDPRQKRIWDKQARKWAKYALETLDQRLARVDAESVAWRARQAAKIAERDARQVAAKMRADLWSRLQGARRATETHEQQERRIGEEVRTRTTNRAIRKEKQKHRGSVVDEALWAVRAERERVREAAQQAKREAKRASGVPVVPPCPTSRALPFRI